MLSLAKSRLSGKILFFVFIACFLSSFLYSTIINVPADQPTIQAGINIAVEGDTVLVAVGIYFENLNWPSTTGINLIGSGVEDCIIDGDSLGSVIRMDYIIGPTTMIDGFTIQNGYANGDNYFAKGGGISCLEASLQLSNLNIIGNSASEEGGGIFCHDSNLNLFDISILNNVSNIEEWNTGGGGVHSRFSTLYMENVNFDNNLAVGSGGGLNCISTTLNMLNIEFNSNQSLYVGPVNNQFGGGGMFCYGGSSYVENAIFSNNYASSNGGGFALNISNAFMRNVCVTNNSAIAKGGGIYTTQSESELIDFLVANNTSGTSGGGLSINASIYPVLLTNVSIINNTSIQGGGICTMLWGPILKNCILWNNEPEEIYGIDHFNGPPEIAISYSDIQGGEAGIIFENGTVYWMLGNINEDPLFLGSGEYPYSLQFDSPCIDAGTPDTTGLNLPEYDLAGNPRIFGGRIDMGAYEWQGTPVYNEELPVINWGLSNHPNPFNPLTTISFDIKEHETGILTIFNIKGQLIESHRFESGKHNYLWDASEQASGIYLYKLQTESIIETRKMLLVK